MNQQDSVREGSDRRKLGVQVLIFVLGFATAILIVWAVEGARQYAESVSALNKTETIVVQTATAFHLTVTAFEPTETAGNATLRAYQTETELYVRVATAVVETFAARTAIARTATPPANEGS